MYGEWETSGVIHKIPKTQVYTRAMRIHLLPLSLVGLTLDDTIETTATFDREQKTLSLNTADLFHWTDAQSYQLSCWTHKPTQNSQRSPIIHYLLYLP